MKKILFVTHNGRFLVQFELNDIRILQDMGYEVHCATNFKGESMRVDAEQTLKEHGVICHQIDIERSPLKMWQNTRAYSQLRLAASATHTAPVIYTAHGFHFYKGCPLKNRLIYQTAETFLARYTDAQITINQEDFAAAQKFPLRGKAYYVPGIGVDVTNAHLLICGSGREKEHLEQRMQELKVAEKVHLLGFRRDVYELLKCSDVFVFPSKQEGLPVALMEAMAAGLPCIASRIRGNVDLLENSRYLFEPADESELCQLLKDVANGVQIEQECAQNREMLKRYDTENVSEYMKCVYMEVLIGEKE